MGHDHKYMGHETANWRGRGLGCMLFNAHLCNQQYYYQVVVEPGSQLCTLLEVWILRVRIRHLDANVSVRRGSGTPKYR
jgi:hypothetical protein